MQTTMVFPEPHRVSKTIDEFNRQNELSERAITEIFNLYPKNTDVVQVLLKVVVTNAICSTNIYAYRELAERIYDLDIDASLDAGSLAVVDDIANLRVPATKPRRHYSFATKFCSFHKPNIYPICDQRARNYLCKLQRVERFAEFKCENDLYDYQTYSQVIFQFQKHFGLTQYTLRDLDKFLYTHGT